MSGHYHTSPGGIGVEYCTTGHDVGVEELATMLGDWVRVRNQTCNEPSPCDHDRLVARVMLGADPDDKWKCPWIEEYPFGCPYCAGELCATFDGMYGCRHDIIGRHGSA